MKIKTLIAYTVLSCTAFATVGVVLLNQKSFDVKTKADPSVPHTITFTYADIADFLDDGGEAIAELTKKTDAGNDFSAVNCDFYYTYGTTPSQGDSEHNYLFKINQPGWEYDYVYSYKVFYVAFEMSLDIENTSGFTAEINWTTHFDDGEHVSSHTETEDFDILTFHPFRAMLWKPKHSADAEWCVRGEKNPLR